MEHKSAQFSLLFFRQALGRFTAERLAEQLQDHVLVCAVTSHFRRPQEECLGWGPVTALLRSGSGSLNPPVYLLSPPRPSTDHDSRLLSLPLCTSVQAHGHPEAPCHGCLCACVRAVVSVCVGGLDGPMWHRVMVPPVFISGVNLKMIFFT